jgi:hypothetical protein
MAEIVFNNGNAVFFKKEEHLFRLYDGFGISASDMVKINENGAENIMIIVKFNDGTEKVYITSVLNWMKKCIPYDNKGEAQTILKRNFFERVLGE